jgi:hypothetical protein
MMVAELSWLELAVTHPASTATAEAAMAAMAAAEMGRGVAWQNSNDKWIQKRSDSSFIVEQKVHFNT